MPIEELANDPMVGTSESEVSASNNLTRLLSIESVVYQAENGHDEGVKIHHRDLLYVSIGLERH